MSEQIKVRISKSGTATIEAIGFVGPACEAATAALEAALGAGAVRDYKPEYHELPVGPDLTVTEG